MSASSDDTFTHTTKVENGQLRLSIVHGRLQLSHFRKDSRIPLTTPLVLDQAEQLFTRGLELVALARASRTGSA